MLKACAFDLGNTLVNDARLLKDVVDAMGEWLRQNGHLPEHPGAEDAVGTWRERGSDRPA